MDLNPYESPLHTDAAIGSVDSRIQLNWNWICLLLLSIAFYSFMLYIAFIDYTNIGFVGGNSIPAAVRWGLTFTV